MAAVRRERPWVLVGVVVLGGVLLSGLTFWALAVRDDQWTWRPGTALVAGLLLTTLLAGYLVLLIGQAARIERVVALRTAELETISNSALDAVVMMDPQGRVVHWNPAAERMFGYSRQEILGRSVHETLVPQRYEQQTQIGLTRFAGTGQGAVVGTVLELEAVRKDGTEFPIEISVSSIRRDDQWWAVAIVRDITNRRKAEEDGQRKQQLLRNLLDLQERERKLLSYEIHDGLAQQLIGAVLQLQAIEGQDAEQARASIDEVLHLLGEATGETRRLIGGLRPPVLDESGIVDAIDDLIAQQQQRDALQVEFAHDVGQERFAAPLENAIFRIVQESLTNAARHSQSEKVRVDLRKRQHRVCLEVEDWGVGFDPDEVAENRFGLHGIRERARLLGGEATVDSTPGQGTRIHVELPLVGVAAEGESGS